MEMGNVMLVTGATGNVGRHVVAELLRRGQRVRAALPEQEMEAARAAWGSEVECVAFDFHRPESVRGLLRGVGRLFLVRPPAIADVKRYLNPVVDAAIDAGVERIVFLSLMGIERARTAPHYKVEQHVRRRGIPYTFLRPSFFMQNLNTFYREGIRDHDEIFLPAGRGRTSFIDVRDIGAVGALAMTEPGHENRAYTLTGSQALDYDEVAAIFSRVLGREIRYARPSPWTYHRRMRAEGVPEPFIRVMQNLYFVVRMGWSATVTPETAQLLGRPPITMEQYVRDYAGCWQPEKEGNDGDHDFRSDGTDRARAGETGARSGA